MELYAYAIEGFNSQDVADYQNELYYIDSGKSDDDDDGKSAELDGNVEYNFLKNIGVNVEDGKEVGEESLEDFFMTLTNRQASTVRKRIATLNATVRKKSQKSRLPDVRDVFSQRASESSGSEVASRSATPNSLDSLSPCRTPPSPPEWPPSNTQESSYSPSSTASQGYHSSYRDDPATTYRTPSKTNLQSSFSVSGSDLKPSSKRHSHYFDTQISKEENNSTPTTKLTATSNDRFSRDVSHRNKSNKYWYDGPPAINEAELAIRFLGYQKIGTLNGGPINGVQGTTLDVPGEGISESEITLQFDDEEPEEENMNNWGVECNELEIEGKFISEFNIVFDKLGLTYISDLSKPDAEKIKTIALIELTALFDQYGIRFNPNKSQKKRKNDKVIFGVSLCNALESDRKRVPDASTPLLVKMIISYLEKNGIKEEGLLRIPGSSSKIQNLKSEVEFKYQHSQLPQAIYDIFDSYCINDIGGLLKQYIRELPVPILTNQYMDAFYQINKFTNKLDQIKGLILLVILLPEAHSNTLKALLDFVANIEEYEAYNRMSIQNLAMILAPNLFLPKKKRNVKRDMAEEINVVTATCNITKTMIKYRKILWTVPGFLLKQVRRQNENASRRALKENNKLRWLPVRKPKTEIYRKIDNEKDFQDGIIRVHAPFYSGSRAVQLTYSMTAGEIVEEIVNNNNKIAHNVRASNGSNKLLKEKQQVPSEQLPSNGHHKFDQDLVLKTHYLYEVKGNIGERRLHHETPVFYVYKENPNADWVIRCCQPTSLQ